MFNQRQVYWVDSSHYAWLMNDNGWFACLLGMISQNTYTIIYPLIRSLIVAIRRKFVSEELQPRIAMKTCWEIVPEAVEQWTLTVADHEDG